MGLKNQKKIKKTHMSRLSKMDYISLTRFELAIKRWLFSTYSRSLFLAKLQRVISLIKVF